MFGKPRLVHSVHTYQAEISQGRLEALPPDDDRRPHRPAYGQLIADEGMATEEYNVSRDQSGNGSLFVDQVAIPKQ